MDNIKLPKENYKKVEEVRYLENTEQEKKKDENQGSKIVEKLEETILPTAHASDKDNGDFDAKIEYVDAHKDSMEHDRAEKERMRQDAIANCEIL